MRTFLHIEHGDEGFVPRHHLITSVRLEEGPGHDFVHVWNRGGKAGTLTVDKGDGMKFVDLLLDPANRKEA